MTTPLPAKVKSCSVGEVHRSHYWSDSFEHHRMFRCAGRRGCINHPTIPSGWVCIDGTDRCNSCYIRWLLREMKRARDRANEAARLSADANDQVNDYMAQLVRLRQENADLDLQRLDTTARLLKVCDRLGIKIEPAGDVLEALERHASVISRDSS